MKEKIEEVLALLKERGLRGGLSEGVDRGSMFELGKVIGVNPPDSLIDLHVLHDGEIFPKSDDFLGLFFDYEFLGLEKIIEVYFRSLRAYEASLMVSDDFFYCSNPPAAVCGMVFDPMWIPFAGYGAGNHLAIDMNPGPAGVVGQVINFGPDDFVHYQISGSLPEFVDMVLERYRERRWHRVFEGDDWSLYDELGRAGGLVQNRAR